MAHGTGYCWIPLYDETVKKEEYVLSFSRLRYYWYPEMSDCYEPTWEDRDEYEARVIRWRTDRYGHKVADCASEGYRTGSIDRDTANKIYWNIKNRNISFATCRKYFEELAGRQLRT